ncbi:hypothetical protein DZG01_16515 [Pseudomonas fluorescens]|nr:hypothetical protein DZG01_16515 [Pseudomonas fluorescens]
MGASLLAIAVYRSTSVLNGKTLSRAGSLPHWFGVVVGIAGNKKAPIAGALMFSESAYMFG